MIDLGKTQEESANQTNNQSKEDYISLYDLIEWAKSKNHGNFINATHDIYTVLKEDDKQVFSYKYYSGIKPRMTKTNQTLNQYVLDLNINRNNLFEVV